MSTRENIRLIARAPLKTGSYVKLFAFGNIKVCC